MFTHLRNIVIAASFVTVFSNNGAAADDALSTTPEAYRVDQSIDRGLAYLATLQLDPQQAQKIKRTDAIGSIAQRKKGNTGITSLSVLAFLSKGHIPGQGPYGETINRGIDFVVSQASEDGLLVCQRKEGRIGNGAMYSHSIATLFLAEISGMVAPARQRRIDAVLPRALAVILKAQEVEKQENERGGWRYNPTSRDSDLSLTGWAVMALRAGRLNGAGIPSENIDRAVEYILRCRHAETGGFAYRPNEYPNVGLTGAGILCLELCGRHGHPWIEPASQFMEKQRAERYEGHMKAVYGMYYASQAAFQLGPEYWSRWAPQLYGYLLSAQTEVGHWPPCDGNCGTAYSTSMAILAMTPPYQQLPIYQRDLAADETAVEVADE